MGNSCTTGHAHAVVLPGTNDAHTVYSWGQNTKFRLVEPISRKRRPQAGSLVVHALDNRGVVAMSVGKYGTMCATAAGELLLMGTFHLSSTRTVQYTTPTVEPTLHEAGMFVEQVVCGRYHYMVLCRDPNRDDGAHVVFTWGCGGNGQLGHADQDSCGSPRRMETLPEGLRVRTLATGSMFSLLLTEVGDLYLWGGAPGRSGRIRRSSQFPLGMSHEALDPTTPQRVEMLRGRIQDASCGAEHVVALTVDGEAYVWGSNAQRQLGLSSTANSGSNKTMSNMVAVPTRVGGSAMHAATLSGVSCGEHHTVCIDRGARAVFVWGRGMGTVPTMVRALDGISIVQVAAGRHVSVALTAQHDVFCWHHSLSGVDASQAPQRFARSMAQSEVQQVACGYEVFVALKAAPRPTGMLPLQLIHSMRDDDDDRGHGRGMAGSDRHAADDDAQDGQHHKAGRPRDGVHGSDDHHQHGRRGSVSLSGVDMHDTLEVDDLEGNDSDAGMASFPFPEPWVPDPSSFVCPISRQQIHDPVFALDGVTYERRAIQCWLHNNNTSPVTGMLLPAKTLIPNNVMRSQLQLLNEDPPDHGRKRTLSTMSNLSLGL